MEVKHGNLDGAHVECLCLKVVASHTAPQCWPIFSFVFPIKFQHYQLSLWIADQSFPDVDEGYYFKKMAI